MEESVCNFCEKCIWHFKYKENKKKIRNGKSEECRPSLCTLMEDTSSFPHPIAKNEVLD
jgi:hypothetical protein